MTCSAEEFESSILRGSGQHQCYYYVEGKHRGHSYRETTREFKGCTVFENCKHQLGSDEQGQ